MEIGCQVALLNRISQMGGSDGMSRVFWTITGTTVLAGAAVFLGFLIAVNELIHREVGE